VTLAGKFRRISGIAVLLGSICKPRERVEHAGEAQKKEREEKGGS